MLWDVFLITAKIDVPHGYFWIIRWCYHHVDVCGYLCHITIIRLMDSNVLFSSITYVYV